MHKKIESELVSIAHGILQMKNKEDVVALQQKAKEAFEKLSVLAFVDRYLETTPDAKESKEALLEKIASVQEVASHEKLDEQVAVPLEDPKAAPSSDAQVSTSPKKKPQSKKQASKEKPEVLVEDLFSSEPVMTPSTEKVEETATLEEELKDTVSLEVAADIFEKAPVVEEPQKKSLHETLTRKNLQIDLNDRIAFVKHLFEGSQEDYNRVVSQLNSFKTEKEAHKFLNKTVKPDYDWNGKEAYEERFVSLINRKFA